MVPTTFRVRTMTLYLENINYPEIQYNFFTAVESASKTNKEIHKLDLLNYKILLKSNVEFQIGSVVKILFLKFALPFHLFIYVNATAVCFTFNLF